MYKEVAYVQRGSLTNVGTMRLCNKRWFHRSTCFFVRQNLFHISTCFCTASKNPLRRKSEHNQKYVI